jgi:type III secretion system FlhB-like substrate exporter
MAKAQHPVALPPDELRKLIDIALKYKKTEGVLRVTAKARSEFETSITDAAAQAGIYIPTGYNLDYILDILEVDNFIPFEALLPTTAVLKALRTS